MDGQMQSQLFNWKHVMQLVRSINVCFVSRGEKATERGVCWSWWLNLASSSALNLYFIISAASPPPFSRWSLSPTQQFGERRREKERQRERERKKEKKMDGCAKGQEPHRESHVEGKRKGVETEYEVKEVRVRKRSQSYHIKEVCLKWAPVM